jgi:hypothetical protein
VAEVLVRAGVLSHTQANTSVRLPGGESVLITGLPSDSAARGRFRRARSNRCARALRRSAAAPARG